MSEYSEGMAYALSLVARFISLEKKELGKSCYDRGWDCGYDTVLEEIQYIMKGVKDGHYTMSKNDRETDAR